MDVALDGDDWQLRGCLGDAWRLSRRGGRIHGDVPARLVDAGGTVVTEARDEIAVPLDAVATGVFVLDLEGRNRYVMTTTGNLAPLLDLLSEESGEGYGLRVGWNGRG